MKLLVLLLLALGSAYRLVLNIVQYRSAGNPIYVTEKVISGFGSFV